jgi:CubicO group peptidase (beta-lactamase class C family)
MRLVKRLPPDAWFELFLSMSMRIIIFSVFVFATLAGRCQLSFDTARCIRDNKAILSLVVSVKDSTIYARSFNGKKNDDLFNNQSLTKSIEAVLIGIVIDKGFIRSINTKLAEIFPELKNDPDKRKSDITIADVMNQASGLWHENLERLDLYLKLKDPSGYVLKQPLQSQPGSELHYNNAASHLMSVILSKTTGQTSLEFARKYLFDPLDIHNVEWPTMNDGYCDGSGLLSIRMSAVDVNKIGRLLLDGGRYKGRQIVSQTWVHALLEPAKTYPAPWGLVNNTYALCFYHKTYRNEQVVYGMGWGGQYLTLIPGLNVVITINQSVNDATAIRQSETFTNYIFPLIVESVSRND